MKLDAATVKGLIDEYGALQHPVEVVHLIEYLRVDPPKLIIEVGVWRGGNAAILKTYFPQARFIGVDEMHPSDSRVSDAPSLADNIERFDLEYVIGDTKSESTVARVKAMIGDEKAGYCFIDASHDTDSVKRDFEMWSPLAHRVGFHDVHNPMVLKAWMDICGFMEPGPRTAALWKEMDGHGIGVVLT
jgi:cephalosporin hydroxylase